VVVSVITPHTCQLGPEGVQFLAGTCILRAAQAGNAIYFAAPAVTQSFPVSAAADVT
jgi:hypothetical protein